jgi:GT2 family glycosyltransferase
MMATRTAAGPRPAPALDRVAGGIAVALLLAVLVDAAGPARVVLALAFVSFAPGWALLARLPLAEGADRLALAVVCSLSICILGSLATLWMRLWSPPALLAGLAALTVVALVQPRLTRRARPAALQPVWVAEVEMSKSFSPRGISRGQRADDVEARLLVRLHNRPLGFVTVALQGQPLDAAAVRAAVADTFPNPSRSSGRPRDRRRRPEAITVVVCTRDRPAVLATCLRQLKQLEYGRFRVIVVDNAPTDDGTRAAFAEVVGRDARFRYVVEPAAGLSRARNRGLQEATTRRVAFTDDDVQVDPGWLGALMAGFARHPEAGCVTGLVPAAELDHPAQHYFERRYSWSVGMEPQVYVLHQPGQSPLYPFSAGLFGTGANFAVDRKLMLRLGGFDQALGAGSPAGGGEDLDAFVRVLLAGRSLVYEPAALVWHTHRTDERALRRQLYAYGVGLTAFLAKYLLSRRTAWEIVRRAPAGLRRGPAVWDAGTSSADGGRASYALTEFRGMAMGPVAYLRGRRRAAR